MALINCPECGKEVSDKAVSCPNCGYPVGEKVKHTCETASNSDKYEDLEENTQLFNCIECGRPLPVGIEKCIWCNHEYKYKYTSDLTKENYSQTGRFGRKKLVCPRCGSHNIKIINDIPTHKKIGEFLAFGTVLPTTKSQYRENMNYICNSCHNQWK